MKNPFHDGQEDTMQKVVATNDILRVAWEALFIW